MGGEGGSGDGRIQQPPRALLRCRAAAAALGEAARQPAPPAAGSLLGVATEVISQRAIPAIEEPLAPPSGVAAEGLIEGLRSPSCSLTGDCWPRALLTFCAALRLPHAINRCICSAGFRFSSPATANRTGARAAGGGRRWRRRRVVWCVVCAHWWRPAGKRSAPWSSQPSRQNATKQRDPQKAKMTTMSSTNANIWIGSSPGGDTGGDGGSGGGSVGGGGGIAGGDGGTLRHSQPLQSQP